MRKNNRNNHRKNNQKWKQFGLVAVVAALLLTGCGGPSAKGSADLSAQGSSAQEASSKDMTSDSGNTQSKAPQIDGLTYESETDISYAEKFSIYHYQDGYKLIRVYDSADYLVVPEGQEEPEGLDEDIVVLQQPLDTVYLAATSVMSLMDSLDALDVIQMSGTDKSGWYVDHAVSAMEAGDIVFAGKYSEPDYELLIERDCNLAIESTMILHSPKVKEMIEDLGIPVFIDCSSYESQSLGRTEWIKVYGALVDKEEEAAAFFDSQLKIMDQVKDIEQTGKTVAFFYVSTDGSVVVRNPADYIPNMIETAGGKYAFDHLDVKEDAGASVSLSVEEFYNTAVNADYLIYNAAIDNPINSIDELLAKGESFADFKAVKEGNVWTTSKYLYQATSEVSELIMDMHNVLTGNDDAKMTFLTKVQ